MAGERVLAGQAPASAVVGFRDRSGGQVVEQLTYVLDLARALLGEPAEVFAAGARQDGSGGADGDVDDATAAAVRGERQTRVPYAEALRTHRLACAVAQSAATRLPVPLPTPPS